MSIRATAQAVAQARAAHVAALMPVGMAEQTYNRAVRLLAVWAHDAGTDLEASARQAIVDVALAIVREDGDRTTGLVDLVEMMLHILFPEDEPPTDVPWRDSQGRTSQDFDAPVPDDFASTLADIQAL